MTWEAEDALAIAEQAPTLSTLIQWEGYGVWALRWLTPAHLLKFANAVDEGEASKLKTLASMWGEEPHTRDFPLLHWIWVAGQVSENEKFKWSTAGQPGTGRMLIARLALYEPDWVGRWWIWRHTFSRGCSNWDFTHDKCLVLAPFDKEKCSLACESYSAMIPKSPLAEALNHVLTQADLKLLLPELPDEIAAIFIRVEPLMLGALAGEHKGRVLSQALGWIHEEPRLSSQDPLVTAICSVLSQDDVEQHSAVLSDEILASIVRTKPSLINAVPGDRRCGVLSVTFKTRQPESNLIAVLSHFELPSDATGLIDTILGSKKEGSALQLLDQLVKKWEGPAGSDPVSRAISTRHERAAALLRSCWNAPRPTSERTHQADVWAVGPPWQRVGPAFGVAALAAPSLFALELGFTIGTQISETGREATADEVQERLKAFHPEPTEALVKATLPMATLWTALRLLAKYQADSWKRHTEVVGLRAKIAALATEAPELWAQALRWIFLRSQELGDAVQTTTLELAATAPVVYNALDSARGDEIESVRLLAQGLWTLLCGIEDPAIRFARILADAAARHMDGVPVFPHPLAPMSATWLGSAGIESAIVDGIRRAASRFAVEVHDQGGDVEEALAKALVKEIESEFRQIQPRLPLFSPGRYRPHAPLLSVRQRPASKQVEESLYGCDIAWLLNAEVQGRYSATWVDLVQIKKSTAIRYQPGGRRSADSWRIDRQQLSTILKWSMTATYWLIASAGEILVVPARHLVAIQQGTRKQARGKAFMVGYHEVRSAAIPLEQYLVDLLIGQWIGTTEERVLRFAQGEDTSIRPRLVVEVTIAVGEQAG